MCEPGNTLLYGSDGVVCLPPAGIAIGEDLSPGRQGIASQALNWMNVP